MKLPCSPVVKAVSDGNIVPAVLEYPEPSTAPYQRPYHSFRTERSFRCSCASRPRPKQSSWGVSSSTSGGSGLKAKCSLRETGACTNSRSGLIMILKEGWHNALNRRAGGQCGLPLYLLIELLDREAKLTSVTIRLVSDNKLKRIQRKVTRNIQAKLFSSWEKYENNEKTAAQLLKTCSRLNGPARAN